jgi:hypothetical protein
MNGENRNVHGIVVEGPKETTKKTKTQVDGQQ